MYVIQRLWHQKQISQAGISYYSILWDVFTYNYACLKYLLLVPKSSYIIHRIPHTCVCVPVCVNNYSQVYTMRSIIQVKGFVLVILPKGSCESYHIPKFCFTLMFVPVFWSSPTGLGRNPPFPTRNKAQLSGSCAECSLPSALFKLKQLQLKSLKTKI